MLCYTYSMYSMKNNLHQLIREVLSDQTTIVKKKGTVPLETKYNVYEDGTCLSLANEVIYDLFVFFQMYVTNRNLYLDIKIVICRVLG